MAAAGSSKWGTRERLARFENRVCRTESHASRVRSLPTEGREEPDAAVGGAERGIRRTVERASARAGRLRPQAAFPRGAQPTCLAGRQGLEPRFTGPEPVVLPLNDLPVARGSADYS